MGIWVLAIILGTSAVAKESEQPRLWARLCAQALRTAPAPQIMPWQMELPNPVSKPALKKVSLIPEAVSEQALQLQTISSIQAENYGLRGFHRAAFEGLLTIFRSPQLTERFVNHWERLGFIRAHVADPYYAQFKLIGENEAFDLRLDMDNPVLQTFLKPYRTQALRGDIDPVLAPISARQRLHALTAMFAQSLQLLDPSKADSLEVLKASLMEVQRLKIEGQLSPETLDKTFAALTGFARFQLGNLRVPNLVSFATNFIPFGGPISGMAIGLWNLLYEETAGKNRIIKEQFIDVSTAKIWQKMRPASLEIIFAQRDFRDLKPKAYALIEKYSSKQQEIFTPAFAQDLLGAYPELGLLFNTSDVDDLVTSPFGSWHPEVQKVMHRAALLLALHRNDARAFSKMSKREFSFLRRKMFQDLGLLDDGRVTVNEIDLLLTFFVTDVLGRAQGPLIDAIDEDFHVSKVVGQYDFERRSAFLLKRYTLLSYSFARQSNADQILIMSLLDGAFTLNMEHILRMDASIASFATLKELDRHTLSFLFYRSLLSFAGNGLNSLHHHSQTMTSLELERWMNLKRILDEATDDAVESQSVYQRYAAWVADYYQLPLDSAKNQVLLRLASIAGINKNQLEVLKRQFDRLSPSESELLLRYMNKYPVLIYGGHEFYDICQKVQNATGSNFSDSIQLWLQVLVKVYQSLDASPHERFRIRNTLNGDVRLFIEPVADLIAREGVEGFKRAYFHAEKFKFGYIIHVGF